MNLCTLKCSRLRLYRLAAFQIWVSGPCYVSDTDFLALTINVIHYSEKWEMIFRWEKTHSLQHQKQPNKGKAFFQATFSVDTRVKNHRAELGTEDSHLGLSSTLMSPDDFLSKVVWPECPFLSCDMLSPVVLGRHAPKWEKNTKNCKEWLKLLKLKISQRNWGT